MKNSKKVMILSGAGLSAESGLKTFRDSGGLWENYDVMEVCSATGYAKNPRKVLEFYDERRIQLKNAQPNHAHKVIAELKREFKEQIFIITQNVDDLLERAGCENVIYLHGFLPEIYCAKCGYKENIGYERLKSTLCPKCATNALRHNIVMFEELAPEYATLYAALDESALFVCIGTSGFVLPVGHFARACEHSILNNLEVDENLERYFEKCYTQKASVAIDKIAADIRAFLRNGAFSATSANLKGSKAGKNDKSKLSRAESEILAKKGQDDD